MNDVNLKFDYKPHSMQQQVHLSCSDNSPNMWTVVCAGRQAGKSQCARFQAMYWALKNSNELIWYLCPSENQCKAVWRMINQELSKIPGFITSKIQSKGDISFSFANGTRMEFKSSNAEDSLRGASVTRLILDECAFIKQNTVEEILLPTMSVRGRKILAISTPKGKNYFYKLFTSASSEDADVRKNFKAFKFSSLDNPFANKKIIAQFKKTLPDAIYRQEMLAEWVDSSGVFTNIEELAKAEMKQRIPGYKYYIGCDIALADGGDYTVITVIDSDGNMVYVDRFRGVEAPELRARILQAYNAYKPHKCLIEENNQGLPIVQDLRRKIQVEGFYTTNETKNEIINELIAAFSLKDIKILNDEILKEELNSFVFKYSKLGKIRFEAAYGAHDDMVMSLAIAWKAYMDNHKRSGGYVVYGHEDFTKLLEQDFTTTNNNEQDGGSVKISEGDCSTPQNLLTKKTSGKIKIQPKINDDLLLFARLNNLKDSEIDFDFYKEESGGEQKFFE